MFKFLFSSIAKCFISRIICITQMEERMTLCNMVVEAGGKNGIIQADATTFKYLEVSFIVIIMKTCLE